MLFFRAYKDNAGVSFLLYNRLVKLVPLRRYSYYCLFTLDCTLKCYLEILLKLRLILNVDHRRSLLYLGLLD